MINESSLAAIEELDIFQPKLDDVKTPSFQEAQEAVAQALQVLKEFYAKADPSGSRNHLMYTIPT